MMLQTQKHTNPRRGERSSSSWDHKCQSLMDWSLLSVPGNVCPPAASHPPPHTNGSGGAEGPAGSPGFWLPQPQHAESDVLTTSYLRLLPRSYPHPQDQPWCGRLLTDTLEARSMEALLTAQYPKQDWHKPRGGLEGCGQGVLDQSGLRGPKHRSHHLVLHPYLPS